MEIEHVVRSPMAIRGTGMIVGVVGRDPEVKYRDGQAVANFSVTQPPGRGSTRSP
jgi:single-stranded DNA-binding protein